MTTIVEPFSFAAAELSDKYLKEFPQSDVRKYVESLSDKTGVQVVKECRSIGLKGSWLSLTRAHALLLDFLETFQTTKRTRDNQTRNEETVDAHHVDKSERNCLHTHHGQFFSSAETGTIQPDHAGHCNETRGSVSSDNEETAGSNDGTVIGLSIVAAVALTSKENHQTKTEGKESKQIRHISKKPISRQASKTNKQQGLSTEHKRKKCSGRSAAYKRKTVTPPEPRSAGKISRSQSKKTKEKYKEKHEYKCTNCDYKAPSRAKLNDHTQQIHKGSPTSCDQCDKVFPNQTYMQRHKLSHVDPQHCCDVCGKMFKVEKAMKNHRRTHEDGYTRPVFHCKMCPKTFCSQYVADCHIKTVHLGQGKSYLCSFCGKKFTTKHSLQEHSNAHTGVKPHICEICGKGFSYDSALRDHKFIHEEVKQFKCSLCFKTFCQRSGLKMHMRIHKDIKQFRCEECGREFTQKQALQRHERVHKGVKPYICRLCSRSFTDASIIRRHLILVHKIHKDAKAWREDIICTVKPDLNSHVGLLGAKSAISHVQNLGNTKTKPPSRRKDQTRPSIQQSSETVKLKKKRVKVLKTVVPLPADELTVQTSSSLSAAFQRDTSAESMESIAFTLALSQANGTIGSYSPKYQNTYLLPETSMSETQSSDMLPLSSHVSAHLLSATSESILDAGSDKSNRCGGTEDQQSPCDGTTDKQVHTAPPVYPANSLADTTCSTVLPHEQFEHQSSVPANCHQSPSADIQQSSLSNVRSSSREESTAAVSATAGSPTSSTSRPSAATTVLTPQPWSSFYYYSQLASQFGVNFTNGGLPGTGLGTAGVVVPAFSGVEHLQPTNPRSQVLSFAHGNTPSPEDLSCSHLNAEEFHSAQSPGDQVIYTESSSHSIQLGQSNRAVSHDTQNIHLSPTLRSPSSLPAQKEMIVCTPHSPS